MTVYVCNTDKGMIVSLRIHSEYADVEIRKIESSKLL